MLLHKCIHVQCMFGELYHTVTLHLSQDYLNTNCKLKYIRSQWHGRCELGDSQVSNHLKPSIF